ncbi:MAG: hypothetical protein HC917_24095 [Richelia sp. SM2_1_7]|nr:hypothetical protein [Richelia sp. SM2_1_7]
MGYSSGMVSRYIHPQELPDEIESVALKLLLSGKNKINYKSDCSKLSAFYFKPLSNIQFSHSQLGEYLCAKAIISQLKVLNKIKINLLLMSQFNYTLKWK